MSNRIVPTDKRGRILLLFSLCFASYLYLARIVLTDFFVGTLGTLLRTFFWLSPILCVGALAFQVVFLGVYVFRWRGQLSPVLFLIGGLIAARFLPIPPLPEEILFSWQQDKFEQIVELARNNQLRHGDDCQAKNQFLPQSGYYQWSSNCIEVYRQQNGLIVEFAPRSLERPIVFIETPTSDQFPPCWSDRESRVLKQLSERWYICKRFLMKEQ